MVVHTLSSRFGVDFCLTPDPLSLLARDLLHEQFAAIREDADTDLMQWLDEMGDSK